MTKWTARDMPDLSGRWAVVTGGNSGLGYETALELACHGASVILAARSPERGEAAAERIRAAGGTACELRQLDLTSLASIETFSESVLADRQPIDILVNNAGIMAVPRALTADGFESQFGTNFLGHFALTARLWPALVAAPAARVVTVSSGVALVGRIDLDDLNGERRYGPWRAYAQSKLADLLFALELDRRMRRHGLPVVSVAAHPGFAATNLQAKAAGNHAGTTTEAAGPAAGNPPSGETATPGPAPGRNNSPLGTVLAVLHGLEAGVIATGTRLTAQPAWQGALPLLFAATDPAVVGGSYLGPDGPLGQRGFPKVVSPPRQARDAATASRLWAAAEELTGVTFPLPATVPS